MKKISIGALLVALTVVLAGPAQAAFTVGGENGWQFGTDGIVDIFSAYQSTSPNPGVNAAGNAYGSLLGGQTNWDQKFGVRVGLLPSIIAFNVKAPTTAGIDENLRVGLYVNVQNSGSAGAGSFGLNTGNYHYDTSPNIDCREFYYTAKGSFGELLAGRALNLFQGQNILNDMTLFTAGVVDMTAVRGGTSLGHIAYGYLYTNFGPQLRYTTPDMAGVKVAFEVAEPYQITPQDSGIGNNGKQNVPRLEGEISYATTFKGGSVHAWLEGMEQTATRSTLAGTARAGGTDMSIGIAPGVNVQFGPVGVMGSGYYGSGLGMVSTQDGGAFGPNSEDQYGNRRTNWGFLGQATYQLTDAIRLAANYGANHQNRTDAEAANGVYSAGGLVVKKCQEAAVFQVNYNLNKFTQFTLEGIWAQDTWQDNSKERSYQAALGTVFFW
jgi:hypothetical protein